MQVSSSASTEKTSTSHWFLDLLRARIKTGRNVLIVVVGELGAGKSYWGLRTAEALDPNFNVNNVVFLGSQFVREVRRAQAGSFILFDEPNLGFGHRLWYTNLNQAIANFVQSSRFLQVNVIFALPAQRFMDTAAVEVCHYKVVMVDRGNGTVYRLKANYHPPGPKIRDKRLGRTRVSLPSKILVDAYEEKRRVFHEGFFKEEDLKAMEDKMRGNEVNSIDQRVNQLVENPQPYIGKDGKLSYRKIMSSFNLGVATAYRVRDRAQVLLDKKEASTDG